MKERDCDIKSENKKRKREIYHKRDKDIIEEWKIYLKRERDDKREKKYLKRE